MYQDQPRRSGGGRLALAAIALIVAASGAAGEEAERVADGAIILVSDLLDDLDEASRGSPENP